MKFSHLGTFKIFFLISSKSSASTKTQLREDESIEGQYGQYWR
jgi:hypothetical protein